MPQAAKSKGSKPAASVEGKRRHVIFMTDEKFKPFKIKILQAGYSSVTEFCSEVADAVLADTYTFPTKDGK